MKATIAHHAMLFRESLGWSRRRLSEISGVSIIDIYLLERLGFEGTPADNQIVDVLYRATLRRVTAVDATNRIIALMATGSRASSENDAAPWHTGEVAPPRDGTAGISGSA